MIRVNERKIIPIGHEDFKRIIEEGFYYVDKTLMIQQLIDNGGNVCLFTRPRRFGKTLNLSMLKYYFEKTEEDHSYLFRGLKITEAGERYWAYQGQYPVISLSLKSMKQPNFAHAFLEYKNQIMKEFERQVSVLESEKLSDMRKAQFEVIRSGKADDKAYATALRFLSDCLCLAYDKKVIILIDEYDVPLENAYFRGFYDEMVDLIRAAFESALKTNSGLEFGVLTGCLRVSKESIFTGLNNLTIYSVLNHAFSDSFGFTTQEIEELARYYDIEERLPEMKKWYDGYLFGNIEIYNPWSVLKYATSLLAGEPIPAQMYWSNTSSNDVIRQLIYEGGSEVREKIELLMSGKTLEVPLYEDVTYRNMDVNKNHIWSFLLYTGYLKPKRVYQDWDNQTYFEAVIPNTEILMIYRINISQWFHEQVQKDSRENLLQALIQKEEGGVEKILNGWLLKTISYYDGHELYYHGFLSGLLTGFPGYEVKSNRESGMGRPDILLLERQRHKEAVIIEVKAVEKFRELEAGCDKALQQIEEQNYEAELVEDGYQEIVKYGIAFCQKSCRVKIRSNV